MQTVMKDEPTASFNQPVSGDPWAKKFKAKKGEIAVDFQYVMPSEAYYHSIKALLNQYIDGEEAETIDTMGLADHICERASIGQVVVSPLDADKDPD